MHRVGDGPRKVQFQGVLARRNCRWALKHYFVQLGTCLDGWQLVIIAQCLCDGHVLGVQAQFHIRFNHGAA